MAAKPEWIWKPQEGPQTLLLKCHIQDILYGGARGGGKTDGALGHWLDHVGEYGKYAAGLFVRRTMPELEDAIARAKELFIDVAEWKEQKKTFIFFGGGSLKFRFLERDTDADKYQGHAYTWIEIEEAGNFPNPEPVDKLRATLRSAYGVKCWFLMTANPGGIGHNWIKERYISPAPPLTPFEAIYKVGDQEVVVRRIFIPAKLSDNKILLNADPNYRNNIILATVGQEWLQKAWLDGDWDIVAGGMFDDIWRREKHVIKPFKIPFSWKVQRAYDWGSYKPFSVGWWAISDGTEAVLADGSKRHFPTGSFFRISEWYGWNGNPNKGLRMLDKDIAEGIVEHEKNMGYKVKDGPADTSIFDEENGQSTVREYRPFGIYWKRADKKPGSRVAGWRKLRELLLAVIRNDRESPHLYCFDTCIQFIRTVPGLPRDKKKLDDVDTNAEDHIGDETRYMIRYRGRTGKLGKIGGL